MSTPDTPPSDTIALDSPSLPIASTPASNDPTTNPPDLAIQVIPANPSDVPALAVLEMTTFVHDPTSLHMYPLRPALVKSGAAPEKWPEYGNMLRRRHKSFVSGQMVFKAVIQDNEGNEKIVGMALLTPPKRLLLKVSIKDRLWDYVIYPTYERARKFMPVESRADGSDESFSEMFRGMVRKTRVEVMKDREYFALNLLFVSPSCLRSGVGSALLKHCTRIADAAHLPVILESTQVAVSLYVKHGFQIVKRCRLEYMGPHDVVEWPVMVREPTGGYIEGGEAGENEVEVESLAND